MFNTVISNTDLPQILSPNVVRLIKKKKILRQLYCVPRLLNSSLSPLVECLTQ